MLYMVIVLSLGRRAAAPIPVNDLQARDSVIVWPVRRRDQVGERMSSDVRHLSAATAGMLFEARLQRTVVMVREADVPP